MTVETFKVTALQADSEGESFFEKAGNLSFLPHASLDGTPNGCLSPSFNCEQTRIHRFTQGTFEDWHIATLGEVYIIYLQGVQQITASSGEVHDFTSGEILWLKDTHGKGHQTRVLESGYSVILIDPKNIQDLIVI